MGLLCSCWGEGLRWENKSERGPHEANFLKLDCSRLKSRMGWAPRWHIPQAVDATVEWTKGWLAGEDIGTIMDRQILTFRKEEYHV